MLVSLLLTLSMKSAWGQNLDLRPTPEQQENVARKLMDGEVCKLDLRDCRDEFSKQSERDTGSILGGGILGGVIGTFLLLGLTGHLK